MKDKILKTALSQFLKYGVRKISIQGLVGPLGISTKTFYKYFKDKEQLLEEALHLYHTQQYEMLQSLSTAQNSASLFFEVWYKSIEIEYKVNKAFYHDLHYYYPELSNRMEAGISKKFIDLFIVIVKNGIEEGAFQESINPEIVVEGVLILYTAIAREAKFDKFGLSSFEVLLNTIGNYIRGFCTNKGLLDLDNYIQTLQPQRAVKTPKKTAASRRA